MAKKVRVVMTSHFPARYRIYTALGKHKANQQRGMPDWLDPKVHTVTRLLKDAGYTTGHFGKWHLGHGDNPPEPKEYGIDEKTPVPSSGRGLSDFPGLCSP